MANMKVAVGKKDVAPSEQEIELRKSALGNQIGLRDNFFGRDPLTCSSQTTSLHLILFCNWILSTTELDDDDDDDDDDDRRTLRVDFRDDGKIIRDSCCLELKKAFKEVVIWKIELELKFRRKRNVSVKFRVFLVREITQITNKAKDTYH